MNTHNSIDAARTLAAGDKGICLKQQFEHKQYVEKYGKDLPKTRNWKRGNLK
jgi:hypothetical protein